MFDHMVNENSLQPVMELYGLKDEDRIFIKEMIKPKPTNGSEEVSSASVS